MSEKKGKFKKNILTFLILIGVGAVAGYIVACVLDGYNEIFPFESKYLFSVPTLIAVGGLLLLWMIFSLNKIASSSSSSGGSTSFRKGKTASGEEKEAYFSARLVTLKELKTNKDYHFCYFT